jgi:hypothetical protein
MPKRAWKSYMATLRTPRRGPAISTTYGNFDQRIAISLESSMCSASWRFCAAGPPSPTFVTSMTKTKTVPLSKFIDRADQSVARSNKMDRVKLIPWDVWAALAVAATVLILAVFNESPLLKFLLIGLALWACIAFRNKPRYRD